MSTFETIIASKFGKYSPNHVKQVSTGNVVIYTRVSTKEQADKNMSLETQRKAIEEYALRQKLNVVASFGGTYESAKTDGRKEFQRMLEFIRKSKGKIAQILVYTLDRFSRTGGAAIKLATDLREKYGAAVFAVTQPGDTSNPSGVLHQNIQLLFSEFDNQQRRQRVIAGMSEKLKKGIWILRPPQGYDIIKINSVKSIVINEEGKKIRKAFEWKVMGMKNDDIMERLRRLGVNMYKQQLHKIFVNPFYCGLITHNFLNGKVVQGKHEALISQELFVRVNSMMSGSGQSGVPHSAEDNNIPLKVFMRCSECNVPFTGYIVKARGLYYYKCRTNGCRCNKSAKEIHHQFAGLLEKYTLKQELIKPLFFHLQHTFDELLKTRAEAEKSLKSRLTEVNKKLETIEEKFYVLNEISREAFEKFGAKYRTEQGELLVELAKLPKTSSNIDIMIDEAAEIALKLGEIWTSSNVKLKEQLQKLVFPKGIIYDRKIGAVRTEKINSVFGLIPQLPGLSGGNEEGTTPFLSEQSLLVRIEGLEPPRLAAPDPKSGAATNYAISALLHDKYRGFVVMIKIKSDGT